MPLSEEPKQPSQQNKGPVALQLDETNLDKDPLKEGPFLPKSFHILESIEEVIKLTPRHYNTCWKRRARTVNNSTLSNSSSSFSNKKKGQTEDTITIVDTHSQPKCMKTATDVPEGSLDLAKAGDQPCAEL